MEPIDTTALALRLGITREVYPEWFDAKCPICGKTEHDPAGWYEADTGAAGCNFLCCGDFEGPPEEWRCTLPSPLSDDPRACLWDGFLMDEHYWKYLQSWCDELTGQFVVSYDNDGPSFFAKTFTAALYAAYQAKEATHVQ